MKEEDPIKIATRETVATRLLKIVFILMYFKFLRVDRKY
jgi:hypothetical protein